MEVNSDLSRCDKSEFTLGDLPNSPAWGTIGNDRRVIPCFPNRDPFGSGCC